MCATAAKPLRNLMIERRERKKGGEGCPKEMKEKMGGL